MEWIDVKESLPEVGTPVLVYDPTLDELEGRCVDLAVRDEDERYKEGYDWIRCGTNSLHIRSLPTHWMPLPEAP